MNMKCNNYVFCFSCAPKNACLASAGTAEFACLSQ